MTAVSAVGSGMAGLFRLGSYDFGSEQPEPRGADGRAPTEIAVRALASRRESVKSARDFAAETLAAWEIPDDLADDLALVVSELVTNALCHGLGSERETAADAPGTPAAAAGSGATASGDADSGIQLALLRRGARLMCAVQDPGPALPACEDADDDAEGGRGLFIVECFSRAWGWFPLSGMGERCGKVVWAMLDIPAEA